MAANTDPIFGRAPDVQVGGTILGSTAVAAMDGTGALALLFSADATEGGFIDEIRFKAVGSPAATVVRFYYCTASGAYTAGTTNTAANTSLLTEFSLGTIASATAFAQSDFAVSIRKQMALGHKILVGFGTSTGAAGVGYAFTAFGAKY